MPSAASLEKILQNSPPESQELPSLVFSSPWWDEFMKTLTELLKLLQWQGPNISFDGSAAFELLGYLLSAIALALTIGLAVFITKHVFGKGLRVSSRPEPENIVHNLQSALEEALGAQDLPRAFRLRWRIFLDEHTLPLHLTPASFFHERGMGTVLEYPTEQFVSLQYQVMFQKEMGSFSYEQFHSALSKIQRGG
jgi:hypothetical protein